MKQIHEIQLQILKKLLYAGSTKFSELRPDLVIENNQLDFHIDQLSKKGYLMKLKDGKYSLTDEGKLIANKYDYDSKTPTMQSKISVVVCPVRNNAKEILIYTRLKNPFYGCQGFMTGKIQYGENFDEAAKRELKEETNLTGSPELLAIRHYRVFHKDSDHLLEDKTMYIFKAVEPVGDLENNAEGQFKWISTTKVAQHITNPLEEFEEILGLLTTKGWSFFKEVNHITKKF